MNPLALPSTLSPTYALDDPPGVTVAQVIAYLVDSVVQQWCQVQESLMLVDEACRKLFPSGKMLHPGGLVLIRKGMAKARLQIESIRQFHAGTPLSTPSSSSSSVLVRGGGPVSPGFSPSPTRQGTLFAAAAGESSSAGADATVAPVCPGAPPHEG